MRRIKHSITNGCRVARLRSGNVEITRALDTPLGPAASQYVRRVIGSDVVIGRSVVRTHCAPNEVESVTRVLGSLAGQREQAEQQGAPVQTTGDAERWAPTPRLIRAALEVIESRPGLSFSDLARALGVDLDQAHLVADRLIAVGLIADNDRRIG